MSKKKTNGDTPVEIKMQPSRRWIIWIVAAALAIIIVLMIMPQKAGNNTGPAIAALFKKQGELTISNREDKPIVSIDIEIADDDSKREVGLMGRPTMEENQGMLFIFQQEEIASFWMKNTILPLDMIFINKNGVIITIHKNTTPFSEQSYTATGMTLFVLEVNAGFCDKYGIKDGDMVRWKRI